MVGLGSSRARHTGTKVLFEPGVFLGQVYAASRSKPIEYGYYMQLVKRIREAGESSEDVFMAG